MASVQGGPATRALARCTFSTNSPSFGAPLGANAKRAWCFLVIFEASAWQEVAKIPTLLTGSRNWARCELALSSRVHHEAPMVLQSQSRACLPPKLLALTRQKSCYNCHDSYYEY